MNSEAQNKAHQCAERAAYYEREFTKCKRMEIIAGILLITVGILTLPLGAFFLILGGMSLCAAIFSHILAEQSHKEFFEFRDEYLKEDQYHDHD
jgi:uncharacterized membrane protein YiaA